MITITLNIWPANTAESLRSTRRENQLIKTTTVRQSALILVKNRIDKILLKQIVKHYSNPAKKFVQTHSSNGGTISDTIREARARSQICDYDSVTLLLDQQGHPAEQIIVAKNLADSLRYRLILVEPCTERLLIKILNPKYILADLNQAECISIIRKIVTKATLTTTGNLGEMVDKKSIEMAAQQDPVLAQLLQAVSD